MLLHIALFNEDATYGFIMGRMDQLFYKFYRHDIDAGILDDDGALELLEQLYLKLNEPQIILRAEAAQFYTGHALCHNISLGGLDKNGADATNDLSYLCLEAEMNVRLPQPDLMIRIIENTPEDFLVKPAR
jgi:formate C-acetyltransferase